jgi:glycosyltransferase involved in cell wall biosynthesis
MTKPLLVSLITVCFNSAKTIEETILSVIAQTHQPIQYIVIDGGSTDGTLHILEKYREHIDILISEPDNGIYDAMNKGILLAQGEVVGLLNADDLYANNQVIASVVKVFADPVLDACFSDLIYFQENVPEKIVRYWRSCSFQPGKFAKGWAPAHPTFFVRQKIYAQYGVFDTRFKMGNDVELMMRFLEKYRINSYYLPQILVKMRLGGVSNRGAKNILLQNRAILEAAKMLGIKISPWQFWAGKIRDRLLQFFVKPCLEEKNQSYAK